MLRNRSLSYDSRDDGNFVNADAEVQFGQERRRPAGRGVSLANIAVVTLPLVDREIDIVAFLQWQVVPP